MKHLFIGGLSDGKWIEVEKGNSQVRVCPPIKERSPSEQLINALSFTDELYLRTEFWECGTVYEIYVLEGEEKNVLGLLVNGYAKENGFQKN